MQTTHRETFGRNLRYLRKLKDLTQKQVADAVNVSEGAYGHFENGRSFPDEIVLVKLCVLLEYENIYKMLTTCLKNNIYIAA